MPENIYTIAARHSDAKHKGVDLFTFTQFTLAPASSKVSTRWIWPCWQAMCNGVVPSCLPLLTSACPSSRRASTTLAWPPPTVQQLSPSLGMTNVIGCVKILFTVSKHPRMLHCMRLKTIENPTSSHKQIVDVSIEIPASQSKACHVPAS